jgi:hypothetical protein
MAIVLQCLAESETARDDRDLTRRVIETDVWMSPVSWIVGPPSLAPERPRHEKTIEDLPAQELEPQSFDLNRND